jgi:drug/metabolite transporter (DMT)-like permease
MSAGGAADHCASGRRRADLALLGVSGVWGATFVMVKDALADVGPLTFVAFRFGPAALALLPLLRLRRVGWTSDDGGPNSAPGLARAGTVVGVCLFAGYAFQTAGLQFTGAGRAGFITGLSVVIVPLLSAVLERRPIERAVGLGVLSATAGLALLSLGDPAARALELNLGDVLVFGCAWGFALHILAVGRLAPGRSAVRLAFAQILVVAVLSGAAALIWERPTWDGLVAVWPAAAFTGLLCTVVGFTVQTRAQSFTSPSHTALIFSTEPVFAALFAYAFAGERLGVSGAQALAIEDAVAGVRSAVAAGFPTVGNVQFVAPAERPARIVALREAGAAAVFGPGTVIAEAAVDLLGTLTAKLHG